MDLAFLTVKLIFALLVVFSLMYLAFKLSGDKINKMNEGKYIKVLERSQISKDSSIVVVKIGERGYILSIASNKVEKLDNLTENEIVSIEKNKKSQKDKLDEQYKLLINKFKSRVINLKKKNN